MSTIVVTGVTDYEVARLVGKFPDYNVYTCRSTEKEYLLKIASEPTKNGLLDREALTLRLLAEEMTVRDEVFKRESGSEHGLGFSHSTPQLVDTFIEKTQSNRRVNIISVYGATKVSDLVPLQQWRTREKVRLDPKSSAWIMGRLLKILTLTQPFGAAHGALNGEAILVNPAKHHVALFDWTRTVLMDSPVPTKTARAEIAAAAREVILALGGSLENNRLPENNQLTDSRYADFLFSLAAGKSANPFKAGQEFYGLLDEIWEPGFHPFTTHPIN